MPRIASIPDTAIPVVTLQQLQQADYQYTLPVQVSVEDKIIVCEQLLRLVPGKRLVFSGTCHTDNKSTLKVLIKLFVHPKRAEKHWRREYKGAQLLIQRGIKTPAIVASGQTQEGVYYLLFEYIRGNNLAHIWQNSPATQKTDLLLTLSEVLAQHHAQGLAHQDLHYANFLQSESGEIYTLDGEEVKATGKALNKKQALKNLALLIAQTFDNDASVIEQLVQHYLQSRSLAEDNNDIPNVRQWVFEFQQGRIKQYLKKILRDCTDVRMQKSPQAYSLCRRSAYNAHWQTLIDDPEAFMQQTDSEFLKQGNTCTVKKIWLADQAYVVKRYNPKGALYELKHKGQMSRARKSWINAHLLQFMGINTPKPVVLIEQTPALGRRRSYFICEYQPGLDSWAFFCDDAIADSEKKQAADNLMALLKRLQNFYISHGDMKGSNFLVEQNAISLLDLDAMQQHQSRWQFKRQWQRDIRRFLQNWEKKPCYAPWKAYFQQHLPALVTPFFRRGIKGVENT